MRNAVMQVWGSLRLAQLYSNYYFLIKLTSLHKKLPMYNYFHISKVKFRLFKLIDAELVQSTLLSWLFLHWYEE